ncbi:ribonuclease H-like domain-containing protein [Tanacetum coccineum]
MAIVIGSLDQGNPLHLYANDSNCVSVVSVKLTSVEIYRIWTSAMKLALHIKHKMVFVNGTCNRSAYVASAPLLEQWDSPGLRRYNRSSKLPARLNEYLLDNKPSSFEEASKDLNWVNAMNDEMHALYENDTWCLYDLSAGRKPIGSKWVFRIKYKSNGEIERYKPRLVAKGFSKKGRYLL